MDDNPRCEFCGDLALRTLEGQGVCVDCCERLKDTPQEVRQQKLTEALTWLLKFYSTQAPKSSEQEDRVRTLTRRLSRGETPPGPVAPVQHTPPKSKALKIRKRF